MSELGINNYPSFQANDAGLIPATLYIYFTVSPVSSITFLYNPTEFTINLHPLTTHNNSILYSQDFLRINLLFSQRSRREVDILHNGRCQLFNE